MLRLVWHEAEPATVNKLLHEGIKQGGTGHKTDKLIDDTDALLDSICPEPLRAKGLSRSRNIYCYIVTDDSVIDITDGAHVPRGEFLKNSTQHILEIQVDPARCYVSDIDAYDRVKKAYRDGTDEPRIHSFAYRYWATVMPLSDSLGKLPARPEVMIPYEVAPQFIRPVKRSTL